MSVRFEWYENPNSEENGEKCYHARPVLNGRVETVELAREIQRRCSLTAIDAKAVLDAISCVLGEHLHEGQRVHVNGLGYFQVALTCEGEEIQEDTKRRNTKVKLRGVNFLPDRQLRNNVGEVKFEHVGTKHSTRATTAEINEKVEAYFRSHDRLTRYDLQCLCGLQPRTAIRQLNRLMAEGKLENVGWSRQPVYVRKE